MKLDQLHTEVEALRRVVFGSRDDSPRSRARQDALSSAIENANDTFRREDAKGDLDQLATYRAAREFISKNFLMTEDEINATYSNETLVNYALSYVITGTLSSILAEPRQYEIKLDKRDLAFFKKHGFTG